MRRVAFREFEAQAGLAHIRNRIMAAIAVVERVHANNINAAALWACDLRRLGVRAAQAYRDGLDTSSSPVDLAESLVAEADIIIENMQMLAIISAEGIPPRQRMH